MTASMTADLFDDLQVTPAEASAFLEVFTPMLMVEAGGFALAQASFREANRRLLEDPHGRQAQIWLGMHLRLGAMVTATLTGPQLADDVERWVADGCA